MIRIIRNSSTCFLMLMMAPTLMAADKQTDPQSEEPAKQPAATKSEDQAAELSVAPLDHVTYPQDRPKWVRDADDGKPFTVTDDNKIVIVSKLCESATQCEELLMISAKVAADAYAMSLVDFVVDTNFYEFDEEELRDLISEEYVGTAVQGDLTMHERAIELTFTSKKRRAIKTALGNVEVDRRLRNMGGFFLGGLVALFGSSAVISTVGRLGRRKKE